MNRVGHAAIAALASLMTATAAAEGRESFITRDGARLMDGDREFRFMGANMPGLVVPYDFTLRWPERMRERRERTPFGPTVPVGRIGAAGGTRRSAHRASLRGMRHDPAPYSEPSQRAV